MPLGCVEIRGEACENGHQCFLYSTQTKQTSISQGLRMKALSYAHTHWKKTTNYYTGPYTCQRIIWYIKFVSFFEVSKSRKKKANGPSRWFQRDEKYLKKKIPHQNARKNRLNVQPDHPVFAYPLVNDHIAIAEKSTHFLIGNAWAHSVSIWKIARWVDPGVYRLFYTISGLHDNKIVFFSP